MVLILLLAAAYGSPNMEFPWWVWALAVVETLSNSTVTVKHIRENN